MAYEFCLNKAGKNQIGGSSVGAPRVPSKIRRRRSRFGEKKATVWPIWQMKSGCLQPLLVDVFFPEAF